MELLKAYLKERRLTLAAFLLFVGVFAVSFALYGLPLAAVGYPAGLCVLLGACLAAWDYGRAARRHKALKRLREAGEAVLLDLPAMTTVEGTDCAAVVETLRRELRRQETARAARWEDMTAYYTAWVHQIKTPIAAMRLLLQDADGHAAAHTAAQTHQDPVLFFVGVKPVPGQKSIVHRPCLPPCAWLWATASWSQRSFSGWPAWPLTQT